MEDKLLDHPELTQCRVLWAVREADGVRLAASQVNDNENMPVRWIVVIRDRLEKYVFDDKTLPMFEDGGVPRRYATSELSELAFQAGFAEWQQAPRWVTEELALDVLGGEYQKVDVIHYELPLEAKRPID